MGMKQELENINGYGMEERKMGRAENRRGERK